MNDAPFEILGTPQQGGFLIIGDHASNRVPVDIDLGIDPALLSAHIAWDIGVAEVARFITQDARFAAYLGGYSRLVVDLNRDADDAAAIPTHSDAVVISGNDLGPKCAFKNKAVFSTKLLSSAFKPAPKGPSISRLSASAKLAVRMSPSCTKANSVSMS